MQVMLPPRRDIEEWQVYVWNLPEDFLSRPQKLQFMLMLEAQFNEFDPFTVVGDLLMHRDLWEGAVMDRGGTLPPDEPKGRFRFVRMYTDLIKLRDIQGHWNVETLFILTKNETKDRLQAAAANWKADESGLIEGDEVDGLLGAYPSSDQYSILVLWWD